MINVGTILMLEHGEYEDHQTLGPFTVLKSFDLDVIPGIKASFADDVVDWLIANEYIAEMDYALISLDLNLRGGRVL